MKWAVGVTTAARPEPTLPRTLASLRRAGFESVRVFDDREQVGAWSNWLGTLRALLKTSPRADVLLACQDDIVCCRGLRAYLDRSLWPDGNVAICSPYCPGTYRRAQPGWHQERRGWHLVGALCWAIARSAAEAIVEDLGAVEASRQIDARVGRWAAESGRTVWYHTPSLVQHTGIGNSALGDRLVNDLRRAADFVGEEADACCIRKPS